MRWVAESILKNTNKIRFNEIWVRRRLSTRNGFYPWSLAYLSIRSTSTWLTSPTVKLVTDVSTVLSHLSKASLYPSLLVSPGYKYKHNYYVTCKQDKEDKEFVHPQLREILIRRGKTMLYRLWKYQKISVRSPSRPYSGTLVSLKAGLWKNSNSKNSVTYLNRKI